MGAPSTSIVSRAAADRDADRAQDLEEGAQVVAGRALERHLAAGDGGRDHERARLDAIGQHLVLGAAQPALAVDHDRVRGRALDVGAHLAAGRR